ncbi:hypothetical protein JB92DRAFT_3133120 [Gautieria morchelliformis]|nr:hypothetical protein JB92DRAFT_3133120 [Gautieria morchelliformis]
MDAILSTYLNGAQSSGTSSVSGSTSASTASGSSTVNRSFQSDEGRSPKGRTVVTQNKGKWKKSVADRDDDKFTSVRIITILPHGLDDDGSLKHATEPTPQQIDELVKLGLATIGSHSQHKFGDNWDTNQIDDHKYQWRLLKAHRWHLELHREMPEGYDVKSAKGCQSKGWQDTKLFFVTHVPITDIVEAMEDIAMQTKKGKGKAVRKRKAVDSDDDIDYNTRSKKRKITGKKSLANSGDDYVIAGPSGQSMKRKARPDDDDAVAINTVDLEASFNEFEATFKPQAKPNKDRDTKPDNIHEYGAPPQPPLAFG